MNKKRILWLILFVNIVIAGMFLTTELLIHQNDQAGSDLDQTQLVKKENTGNITAGAVDITNSIIDNAEPTKAADGEVVIEEATAGFATDTTNNSLTTTADTFTMPQLIYDCSEVNYQAYIPEMQYDTELDAALDITNPDMDIDAEAAILFDADTKQVLYYKNPVQAVFPASTLKLLTSIVALNWCKVDEVITIGDEITMIASDSTRAYLQQGEILTLESLLEGMLLPSGNDAAYAVATYVGRKSLNNANATKEEAVVEFVRLMNEKAKELGVKNSCFKTPDGYDAIGQYTTAYDMGLIGMAAAGYDEIIKIAGKSKARTTFVSGRDVTWKNTNKLISRYSGEYYSKAVGLKTGTSTMAGRCLVAAAESEDREVICVVLDSTSVGRWEDTIELLKYALD